MPDELKIHLARCFYCASPDTRPSETVAVVDFLFRAVRRVPFRCRACHKRFYVPLSRALSASGVGHTRPAKG